MNEMKTAEDLYNYIHSKINFITDKYKDLNVCEFDENKMCVNNNEYRRVGEGCCGGCKYHDINVGCKIPNINLLCMSVYCSAITKINSIDKKQLKSIELILRLAEIQPRTNKFEQIKDLENLGKYLNTSDTPLDDLYNLFELIENKKVFRSSVTKEHYLEVISIAAKETSEREQCTKHVNWNEESGLFYLSYVFDKNRTIASFTNGIESDLKLVTSVAQETSQREKCTKHVNWNTKKQMYFISDIYVEGTTLVSFTNGIKR